MDGIEVLRSLKNDPKFSMIPFLILSGGSDERAIKIAKDLQVGAYLIKGISIAELLAKVKYFLTPTIPSLKTHL